jgi:geranylgeranyl diphosphate synthase type II
MAECRDLVVGELSRLVAGRGEQHSALYRLMMEYPLRSAKALRPSLCIAFCRGLGGTLHGVLGSATALELYHNAFLIHDDIEDGSEKRRDKATLHRTHGMPVAVNVGDAMLALTLEPLLENTRLLGVGKALRILQLVSEMARKSAEGQALELDWIRTGQLPRERDYLRMIYLKTTVYSFITPAVLGALVAGADDAWLSQLRRFATALGTAFQIQDDILNLVGDERSYGKEIEGDLWEGKYTLILLHALRSASAREAEQARAILQRARAASSGIEPLLHDLEQRSQLTREGRLRLLEALAAQTDKVPIKSQADVSFLRGLIDRYGSIEYARAAALRRAHKARNILRRLDERMPPSVHRDFLHELTDFVLSRRS